MRKIHSLLAVSAAILTGQTWAQVQVQAQVVQPQPQVIYQQAPQVVYQQQPQVVVAPPPGVVVPPGVVYVAPAYAAPGVGFVWTFDARRGWGWYHPHRGWYRR